MRKEFLAPVVNLQVYHKSIGKEAVKMIINRVKLIRMIINWPIDKTSIYLDASTTPHSGRLHG